MPITYNCKGCGRLVTVVMPIEGAVYELCTFCQIDDQLDLHDEFMVHDTDYGWGARYAEDDYDGYSLIGFEFLNGVQYMAFMDLDPWAGSAMAGLMPSTLHMPVVAYPHMERAFVSNWWHTNDPDPYHTILIQLDEGSVEGVDSHAYYGPMTTMTNFIEAQRDRMYD